MRERPEQRSVHRSADQARPAERKAGKDAVTRVDSRFSSRFGSPPPQRSRYRQDCEGTVHRILRRAAGGYRAVITRRLRRAGPPGLTQRRVHSIH
jgi:hypothetical protein